MDIDFYHAMRLDDGTAVVYARGRNIYGVVIRRILYNGIPYDTAKRITASRNRDLMVRSSMGLD